MESRSAKSPVAAPGPGNSKFSAAVAAIAELRLVGSNLIVARHWLSRWHANHPPTRATFNVAAIMQHRPAMLFCKVVKGRSVTCVSAGSFVRLSLGVQLDGQDLLAQLPENTRAAHLDWAWQVAQGAVNVLHREFRSKSGLSTVAQGIALPFSGEDADGARHFLMHSNWHPEGNNWVMGNMDVELGLPQNSRLISFVSPPPSDVVHL